VLIDYISTENGHDANYLQKLSFTIPIGPFLKSQIIELSGQVFLTGNFYQIVAYACSRLD